MRPMSDPNYRYTPWTPERRKAASQAAKARLAVRPPVDAVTADAFLREMHAGISRSRALMDHIEAILCATRYMQIRFPRRAAEMEEQYKILASIANWE